MTPTSFAMAGKVALITGSSRGIGRAIAEAFAEAGAGVVVSSRSQDACERVARAIRSRGAEAVAIACNVSDRDAIDALATEAVERLGPIDVLVGNAAANPYFGPLRDIDDRAWDKVMGTNVRSNLWLCNRAIPGMAQRGGGAVILVSSIAAFKGDAALGAYAVSKAAELQLVRSPRRGVGPGRGPGQRHRPRTGADGLREGPVGGRRTPGGARTGHPAAPDRRAGRHRRRGGVPRFARRSLRHRPVHRGRRRRDDCGSGRIDLPETSGSGHPSITWRTRPRESGDRSRTVCSGALAARRTGCIRKDPTVILNGSIVATHFSRGRMTCR